MQSHSFKYFDWIMTGFVTVLLCSNLIGASKVVTLGPVTFGAGTLFFPISYFFNDVLTEVYGYKRSRRVVWAGFSAMLFASVMSWIIVELPPAQGWEGQAAVQQVFGQTPRIFIASLIAFFCGEFSNSFVLAKMKLFTNGKWLWTRTIGSTVVGEAVDSAIFFPLAFGGQWGLGLLFKVMVTNYTIKVLWEVLSTPLTYELVGFLKKAEHEDYYDWRTKFNPFSLKV